MRNDYGAIQLLIFDGNIRFFTMAPRKVIALNLFCLLFGIIFFLFFLYIFFMVIDLQTILRVLQKRRYESMYKHRNKKWSKDVKNDNFCFRKVGRTIVENGAKEKSPILLINNTLVVNQKSFSHFGAKIIFSWIVVKELYYCIITNYNNCLICNITINIFILILITEIGLYTDITLWFLRALKK